MINEVPQIKETPKRIFAGRLVNTSFANDKTAELWRSFSPLVANLRRRKSKELFSLQVYPDTTFFSSFNPQTQFTKWALAEIEQEADCPEELELFYLPAGLYAVFIYKGNPHQGANFFRYIFGTWLPSSVYELDNRPHFEIIGEKYKNNQDDSEEEIWIPVKLKTQ